MEKGDIIDKLVTAQNSHETNISNNPTEKIYIEPNEIPYPSSKNLPVIEYTDKPSTRKISIENVVGNSYGIIQSRRDSNLKIINRSKDGVTPNINNPNNQKLSMLNKQRSYSIRNKKRTTGDIMRDDQANLND